MLIIIDYVYPPVEGQINKTNIMEIILLSIIVVMMILLFIKVNSVNENLDILLNKVDIVDESMIVIEQNLKSIKENIETLEKLCNSIKSDIISNNNSIIRNENDIYKYAVEEFKLTRELIKEKNNIQLKSLTDAGHMLHNDIITIADGITSTHKELMEQIKANKTNRNKVKKDILDKDKPVKVKPATDK